MKRFLWRSVLYAVILLYLFLDLRVWQGPLHSSLLSRRDASLEAAAEEKWVALVNLEPVTQEQLGLAVARHLYQRGKFADEIPEANLAMIRRAVLRSLIDDILVQQYAKGDQTTASETEIDEFVESWESQFNSEEELAERSALQNLSPGERRTELANLLTQTQWLEQRVAPGVDVTEAEVRDWFEANRETGNGFTEPIKIKARHIFLSTVETDDESREELVQDIHGKLVSEKETFEALAKTYSEDERTKKQGGELNWFSRERVPEDFGEAVFAMGVGEISEPFRTSIGWEIVEVLDRQPERDRSFEEMEKEIRLHLENERTAATVELLLGKLRAVANIRLFPEHF